MVHQGFFVVVLLRVLWFGGVPDDHSDKWLVPPQARTIAKIEPSLVVCDKEGEKWLEDAVKAVQQGDFPTNMGTYRCDIIAVEGFNI
jgi:hypothetical protein